MTEQLLSLLEDSQFLPGRSKGWNYIKSILTASYEHYPGVFAVFATTPKGLMFQTNLMNESRPHANLVSVTTISQLPFSGDEMITYTLQIEHLTVIVTCRSNKRSLQMAVQSISFTEWLEFNDLKQEYVIEYDISFFNLTIQQYYESTCSYNPTENNSATS